MGHATTKTTEEHYGRISNDRAISDIGERVAEDDSFSRLPVSASILGMSTTLRTLKYGSTNQNREGADGS